MWNWKNKFKDNLQINKEKISKDKYLDMAINTSNWRKIAFALTIIIFILLIGIISISKKNTIQTFVVEKNGNEYSVLGKVEDLATTQKKASEEQIIYFLKLFIEKTKSITPSVELYKKNYETVRSFMNLNTSKKLENYLVEGNYKINIIEKKTVEVIYNTGIQLDKNTYQIRWVQRTYNKNGEIESSDNYIGVFSITFVDIKDKNTLINNPLGLLITDYRESKENMKKE